MRAGGFPPLPEQLLDRLEGGNQPSLIGAVELAQHCRHRVAGAGVDRRVERTAGFGQRDDDLSSVALGGPPVDQPTLLEPAEDSAQITGVETELGRELRCRRPLALCQFPDHPTFGQR